MYFISIRQNTGGQELVVHFYFVSHNFRHLHSNVQILVHHKYDCLNVVSVLSYITNYKKHRYNNSSQTLLTANKKPLEVNVSIRFQNGNFNFQLCCFITSIVQIDKYCFNNLQKTCCNYCQTLAETQLCMPSATKPVKR